MLGLTFEKLFVVAVLGALIIGPRRLPVYAGRLGALIRTLRHMVDDARATAEREMGLSLTGADWGDLDPRQYDPRRIVREAMAAPRQDEVAPAEPDAVAAADLERAARAVRPGQQYVVTGSAAHPRRVRIDSLPEGDPRRIAADMEEPLPAVTPSARPTP